MSQYLAVVASRPAQRRLDRWLRSVGADGSEVARTAFDRSRQLTIVSRDVARKIDGSRFFVGVAVDPDHAEIAFGLPGWRQAHASRHDSPTRMLGGGFVELSWSDGRLRARRDGAGSIALLSTGGRGWLAASDSLLLLVALRRALGESATPAEEPLFARSRSLTLSAQAMSDETIVSEVAFAPGGATVDFMLTWNGRLRREVRRDAPLLPVVRSRDDYRDALRLLAGRIVGQARISAGAPTRIMLSGGQDSRVVLAAFRRAGTLGDVIVSSSRDTASHVPDFEIAQRLSKALDFPLLQGAPPAPAPREFRPSPIPVWAASHLGVYDRLFPGVTGGIPRPGEIAATGTGAGVLKGAYGWRTLGDLDALYRVASEESTPVVESHRAAHRAFVEQLRKGMIAAGADPDDRTASERHYASYRDGLHGNTASALTLLTFRLLQQPMMRSMSHTHTRFAQDADDPLLLENAFASLLALMDADLPRLPFLDASRNVDDARLAKVLAALGGPLTDAEIPGYVAHGRPADADDGPSEIGLRVAERAGYDFDGTTSDVLDRVESFQEAVAHSEPLRIAYRHHASVARTRLVRDGAAPHQVGPSLAKALSLGILLG